MKDEDEDDERWMNFICFKVYATDSEMSEMAPWVLGVVVVLGFLWFIFS